MTVDEIFTKLAEHMIEGIMTHNDLMRAYNFLGLYGFAKSHEYHYLEESGGYVRLLGYYSTRYHKLLNVQNIPKPEIIPDTWYKYTTMAVDANTKRQAVKSMMDKWVEWERKTKKLYQEMYKELCNINEVAAADEVKCFICAVDEELKHAEKKLIKLETLGYDISAIVGMQESMYKKFNK